MAERQSLALWGHECVARSGGPGVASLSFSPPAENLAKDVCEK